MVKNGHDDGGFFDEQAGLDTPVALILFNREESAVRVMERIAKVRPRQIFLIADGPRSDRPGEAHVCARTRAAVEALIQWDCEVHKCYADENLGCGHRPASGISWVFEHVESAIILEDDCIPDLSFFAYCQEALERYRDDERVMHVSGCTYRAQAWDTEDSFFFSRFPACWGWATWRRAWKLYDLHCNDWPELRGTGFLSDIVHDPEVAAFWAKQFDEATRAGDDLHYWDYQWAFACWANSGLAVCPKWNLISNVGIGEDATHTKGGLDTMFLPTFEMPLPMRHPKTVLHDADLDEQYINQLLVRFAGPKRDVSLRGRVKRMVPKPLKSCVKKMMIH